jgi:hypothetical protein
MPDDTDDDADDALDDTDDAPDDGADDADDGLMTLRRAGKSSLAAGVPGVELGWLSAPETRCASPPPADVGMPLPLALPAGAALTHAHRGGRRASWSAAVSGGAGTSLLRRGPDRRW